MKLGSHPWADSTGKITPESAGVCVANWILTAGGKATTAFQCALEIAKDMEIREEERKKAKP